MIVQAPLMDTIDESLEVENTDRMAASREIQEVPSDEECSEPLLDNQSTEVRLPKRRRHIVVEPVLALYFMAYVPGNTLSQQFVYAIYANLYNLSDYAPPNQNLTDKEACLQAGGNDSYTQVQILVQTDSATFNMYLDIASAVFSCFTVFLYGSLSDTYGRKLAMILPLVGNILKYSIYTVLVTLETGMYFLLLGNALDGLLGGSASLLAACFAYIADMTDHEKRTFRLTINEVIFNMANAAAQVIFGILISKIGYIYPFYVLLTIQTTNLIYVIFFVPDTIKVNVIVSLSHVVSQIWQRIQSCFRVYTQPDQFGRKWSIPLCTMAVFFCGLVFISRFAPTTQYELNSPLCWDSVQIGVFSAVSAILINMGSILSVSFLMKRLGDTGLAILGCISSAAGFIVMSLATETWIMYMSEYPNYLSAALQDA